MAEFVSFWAEFFEGFPLRTFLFVTFVAAGVLAVAKVSA